MKIDRLQKDVFEVISNTKDGPLAPGEIAAKLDLKGHDRKRLQKILLDLVRDGQIVNIRGNRYALGQAADLVTGALTVVRGGRGIVISADGKDEVWIEPDELGTALPGDLVVARLDPKQVGSRKRGKIIRIVERRHRDLVGTLRRTGNFLCVVPIDPAYRQDFYVPDAKGANPGDKVVVHFTNWENRHVSPEGEIVEVIGPSDNPSLDTLTVVRHFAIRDSFPPEVLREAETVSDLLEKPGERMDLTTRRIITIDPERARDFDDALSLEKDNDGRWVLGVHIADVSHFVRPGSALDREAAHRGNSTYFPDKVIPMLPEQLSNGVCSLNPGVRRMAFSAFLTYDAQMRVVHRAFARSVIRSARRFTYEEVLALLRGKAQAGRGADHKGGLPECDEDTLALLQELSRLAQRLRQRRFGMHALDLDLPEHEVVIGTDGRIEGIRLSVTDESHQLVEECMIAANEAVAAHLHNRTVPCMARLHEPPREEKIAELTEQLVQMGFEPGDLQEPANMAAFLCGVREHPLGHLARVAVLRAMNRAVYAGDRTGHFGLAKKFYAHFTSPIRRYPDLTVHRQLAAALLGERPGYDKDELNRIALACSRSEQTSDEAERLVIEIKKYRYLEQMLEHKSPEPQDAVIVSVTNFGVFVELVELRIQGLVHISGLSGGFLRYDREQGVLRGGNGLKFAAGQALRVVPVKVDFNARKVDFALAGEQPGRQGRTRTDTGNTDRHGATRTKMDRRGGRRSGGGSSATHPRRPR